MSIELLIGLIALALIDSTSIGTLLIPVWLLLDHREVRASSMMIYLLTISGFYLLVGLGIMLGADLLTGIEGAASASDQPDSNSISVLVISIAQLAIGIWLFIISYRFDSSKPGAADRVERWKQKAADATTSVRFLMGLALFAAMAEVATMLPYLGAIAMLTSASLAWPLAVLLMIAYCLIMILPAMVLLGMRLVLGDQIKPTLMKIDSWITKNAETALGWVLGIAGFWISIDAIGRLVGWFT